MNKDMLDFLKYTNPNDWLNNTIANPWTNIWEKETRKTSDKTESNISDSINIEQLKKQISEIQGMNDETEKTIEKENRELEAYNQKVKKCIKELIEKYDAFKATM